MKINILDKKLANMISAGEVVENPASVVKELVENSIDAGATAITIEIQEGGTKLITITDDGCGIERDDVKIAFMPHTTSKICKPNDLGNIQTLGFRGEALASISTVSEVELSTKTENGDIGTRIKISGGEVLDVEDCALENGTKIVVKNLFFNTPARKKFLNKDKIEENAVTKIVERFMLSYPKIKFKYKIDNTILYNTAGTNLFDNIFTIYGKNVAENLIKVEYANDKYTLEGYISNTKLTKPNRSYQVSFLNGRMVKDVYMENAIQFAYQDYLMVNNFPVCFLNLKIPYNTVDVNIHPSKQEVKYENVKEINSFFIEALKTALENNHIQKFDELFPINVEEDIEPIDLASENFRNEMRELSENFGTSFKKENNLSLNSTNFAVSEVDLSNFDNDNVEKDDNAFNLNSVISNHFKDSFEQKQEQIAEVGKKLPYKIVGTIFSTYIILEQKDKILLIDQHACHERKLYDKFVDELENSKHQLVTQTLIFPYSFTTSADESDFFLKHTADFAELGFKIEEFGNNVFRITEVPFLLRDIEFGDFVQEVKTNLNHYNISQKHLLKAFLAKSACKSAIKAGHYMHAEDIEALLKDLDEHKVLLCPHGRPIVYEISKREIEKWFKRIV